MDENYSTQVRSQGEGHLGHFPRLIVRTRISFDHLIQNHSNAPRLFTLAPPPPVWKIPVTAPDYIP